MTKREERLEAQQVLRERYRENRMGVSMKEKGSPVTGLKRGAYKLVYPGGYVEEKETPWGERQRRVRRRTDKTARASRRVNQRQAALARRARQKRNRRRAA